jgi:hypothetical protein
MKQKQEVSVSKVLYPNMTAEEVKATLKEKNEENLRSHYISLGLSEEEANKKIADINAHLEARKLAKHGK